MPHKTREWIMVWCRNCTIPLSLSLSLLVFSGSSWEGFVQKVHHSCPPSQRLCTSVFQSVFLLVVEHLFQSVVAFVFVFLTLLYGGYVFKDAWQLSSLQSGDEQSFTFELLASQLFSLKTFHSCQCKTFLKQPLLKCHCTPLDAFRPPKLCLYLQKIPRLKLESAPLRILCRICQLKKVFDLGERVLRRHFCGAREKFKSCWSSEHTLSSVIIITVIMVIIDDDHHCHDDSSHLRLSGVFQSISFSRQRSSQVSICNTTTTITKLLILVKMIKLHFVIQNIKSLFLSSVASSHVLKYNTPIYPTELHKVPEVSKKTNTESIK